MRTRIKLKLADSLETTLILTETKVVFYSASCVRMKYTLSEAGGKAPSLVTRPHAALPLCHVKGLDFFKGGIFLLTCMILSSVLLQFSSECLDLESSLI